MGLFDRRTRILLCGAAIGLIASAASAQAQQAQTTQDDQEQAQTERKERVTTLQRVVVGTGVSKLAIDTPQAVTVIDQEDIDQRQATTVGDIFRETPGVEIVGSDRVFGEAFNIRGIGQTENSADAARIVVTVDGAPKFNEQYRMGSFFADPELYKRVEVLRGPASSTLYGSGALGGVINFVTKDASDFIADGQTGAVRLKSAYETNGDGTLVSGIWAHRFNERFEVLAQGNWRRSNNFEKANGLTLAGSEFSAYSGLLKGTWNIDGEQTVRASYQRWDSDADDQPYAQTGTVDPMGGFGVLDNRHVVDQTYVLSYENPAANNPWLDLNVALTYSDTSNSQGQSDSPYATDPTSPGSLSILFPTDYAYRTLQLKADNTFDYIGENFENYLTVGFQASHQERLAERPTGAAVLPSHPQGKENKLGLFVQNEFIWNDRLTIIPGARVDFYDMKPDASVATYADAQDEDGTAFSPKIAALYKFNENFNIFGSVAHTERFPTLDELYSVSYGFGPFPTKGLSIGLKKEESNNYEIGFGTQFYDVGGLSNTLGFKVTGFYNDIKNGIRSNPASGGIPLPSSYINANNVDIYGFEVEGSYESEYFFGRLAYTNLTGKYSGGFSIGNTTVLDGQPLETVPQDKLILTLGGRIPDYDLTFGATTTFAAEGDYVISAASSGDPDVSSDSWTRVDLFASWKPQEGQLAGWEAQVGVQNLFNEDYRENLAVDRSKGRTVKFTLAKQFGY